jgi:hypothetical protein
MLSEYSSIAVFQHFDEYVNECDISLMTSDRKIEIIVMIIVHFTHSYLLFCTCLIYNSLSSLLGDSCIAFENYTASIGDLMVTK